MADAPYGFKPVRHLTGGEIRTESLTLTAANAIIGKGDLLSIAADGTVDRAAAADTTIVGVAAAPAAASDGTTILAYIDPNIVYRAQTDDGTGTLTAQTGINLNADFVVANATSGISRMEIDENTGATTATLPLKVLGLYNSPSNAFGEFNELEVIINNHIHKSLGVDGL